MFDLVVTNVFFLGNSCNLQLRPFILISNKTNACKKLFFYFIYAFRCFKLISFQVAKNYSFGLYFKPLEPQQDIKYQAEDNSC